MICESAVYHQTQMDIPYKSMIRCEWFIAVSGGVEHNLRLKRIDVFHGNHLESHFCVSCGFSRLSILGVCSRHPFSSQGTNEQLLTREDVARLVRDFHGLSRAMASMANQPKAVPSDIKRGKLANAL